MKARHIPNIITIGRIALVYPVISQIASAHYGWALVLFVIAGLSDGVDGFLAKYFHWESRLGSYLDPLADKLLLVSSYVSLAWTGLLPVWLAAAVVLRDLVIFTGAIAYYFLLHPFEGRPLLISKLNTLLQLLLVFVVLFRNGFAPLPEWLQTGLIAVVLMTTAISGLLYVYIWGSTYYRETRSGTRGS